MLNKDFFLGPAGVSPQTDAGRLHWTSDRRTFASQLAMKGESLYKIAADG